MTYNFDPDKWYENEISILKSKVRSGEITEPEYKRALDKLDRRLEKMWNRLDGTYQIQGVNSKRKPNK